MNRLSHVITAGVLAYSASAAQAHEFWIDPADFFIMPGDQIIADLRVGSDMKGIPQPYIDNNIERSELYIIDMIVPIEGRLGDRPALNIPAAIEGLATIVHVTTPTTLTYRDFRAFNRFVAHKNMNGVLAQHAARSLPPTGFQESYTRHAKSLVSVGDGAGVDQPFGLKVEIVALANPYTDDLSTGLPLQVLLDGAPRADAQLELFGTAPDGTITRAVYRTDADGKATVTVEPGVIYLADNVAMTALPNDDPAAGPVWQSDWASLTFQVPPAP